MSAASRSSAEGWKAGVAHAVITPNEPMWLAGWAARREPAHGKAGELYAKALALEDAAGQRVVIVTSDLIAIVRLTAQLVARRIEDRHGLARRQILFNASHTHTGPEVRPDKVPFFEIPAEFATKIPGYVEHFANVLTDVITQALATLEPAVLEFGHGHAGFAANRRAGGGPTDHDVPVLSVRDAGGGVRAILFGYACHNLTLPPAFCAYHGDYAGIAQREIERRFPGAVALFLAGAGADQDPAPRGTLELAESHGAELAAAVTRSLAEVGRAIAPTLAVALEEVGLDLLPLPARAALEQDLNSDDSPRRRKANYLLAALAEQRTLPATQACPVQVVRLGGELLLIAFGGEPVIDFALQCKKEFGAGCVWVAGYSNDMFGYLPTRRVQQEGGYESGRAALWSALPMPVAESSEERVVAAVRRLVSTLPAEPR